MDVVAFFVSNLRSSLLEQSGKGTLDDAAVCSQAASMCDMSLCCFGMIPICLSGRLIIASASQAQSAYSSSGVRLLPPPGRLIAGMESTKGIAGNSLLGVVFVGSGLDHRKRDAFAVADDMSFRAVFAAICGIGASFLPPKRALAELLSTTALDQSI